MRLNKKISFNYLMGIIFLAAFLRTLIEWMGNREDTFVYAIPTKGAGFLNSLTWLLFLVVINPLILNYFLNGSRIQFKKCFQIAALSFSLIYILVGLLDVGLSYHFTRFPVWYNIPSFIFPVYMPAGCLFGFLFYFITGPLYLKNRIYSQINLLRISFILFFCGVVTFLYGYQICLWIPFYVLHSIHQGSSFIPIFDPHYNIPAPLKTAHVLFEALLFLIPVIFCFPLIIKIFSFDSDAGTLLKNYLIFFVLILFLILYLTINASQEVLFSAL